MSTENFNSTFPKITKTKHRMLTRNNQGTYHVGHGWGMARILLRIDTRRNGTG